MMTIYRFDMPAPVLKTELPRWPGGPRICKESNRCSFKDVNTLKAFYEKYPAMSIEKIWKCDYCEHFHANGTARPTSGSTSGKKLSTISKEIEEMYKQNMAPKTKEVNQDKELI